jgi:excisionase family DNA binding protein
MQRITHRTGTDLRSAREVAPSVAGHPIKLLSVRIAVAVQMTGIGRSKLYELIQEGEIEIVKIGSATLIPVASLEQLLEKNRR